MALEDYIAVSVRMFLKTETLKHFSFGVSF